MDYAAIAAMLLQQLIVGGYSVVTQYALDASDPIAPELFALIRDYGASLILLSAAACMVCTERGHNNEFFIQWSHAPRVFLVGFCGIWGSQLLGVLAIKEVGGVVFAAMQPAQPVLTLLISVVAGLEPLTLRCPTPVKADRAKVDEEEDARPGDGTPEEDTAPLQPSSGEPTPSMHKAMSGWIKLIGVVLTALGAILMVLLKERPPPRDGKDSGAGVILGQGSSQAYWRLYWGYGLLFTQIFLGALYGIVQKRLLLSYPAVVVCAWGYVAGALEITLTVLLTVPVSIVAPSFVEAVPLSDVTSATFWRVPSSAVLPILYSIVFMSAVGYSIMSWVNQRANPVFVTVFYPAGSLMTAFLAWFFLGAQIGREVIQGGLAIIIGLYCVLYAKSQDEKPGNGHAV
mmetsp:Transcript_20323/g.36948  ORF Transcript_20323/g.36948 Transcript_20323/m.36948 type:complete len:401 (+) Transcript_20323:52-1254(+)